MCLCLGLVKLICMRVPESSDTLNSHPNYKATARTNATSTLEQALVAADAQDNTGVRRHTNTPPGRNPQAVTPVQGSVSPGKRKNNATAITALATLRAEHSDLKKKHQDMTSNLKDLQDKYKKLEEEKDEIDKNLQITKGGLKEAQKQLQDAEKQLRDAEFVVPHRKGKKLEKYIVASTFKALRTIVFRRRIFIETVEDVVVTAKECYKILKKTRQPVPLAEEQYVRDYQRIFVKQFSAARQAIQTKCKEAARREFIGFCCLFTVNFVH